MTALDVSRIGDLTGQIPQRNPRLSQREDGWYFSTREQIAIGPFASQELAQRGVDDYVAFAEAESRYYLHDEALLVPDESGLGEALTTATENSTDTIVLEVFDRRRTDKIAAQARSHRVFERNGAFFFAVRNGGEIGPYPSHQLAEAGVMDFVSYTLSMERKG